MWWKIEDVGDEKFSSKTVKTVTNISKFSPSYLVYCFIYTSIKTKVYGVHRCCWRMLVTYVRNGYWWRILETIFYCIQLKSNRIFHFQNSFWISFWTTISPLFRKHEVAKSSVWKSAQRNKTSKPTRKICLLERILNRTLRSTVLFILFDNLGHLVTGLTWLQIL